MTKEQIIKWLDEGYCVPVELRDGSRCIIDPKHRKTNFGNYCWNLAAYESLLLYDGGDIINGEDIVKVYEPFKQSWESPIWEDGNNKKQENDLRQKLEKLEYKIHIYERELKLTEIALDNLNNEKRIKCSEH